MTYIEELESAIVKLHGCEAVHVGSVPVTETFKGKVAWTGEVSIFDLSGHPKARRAYAWGHADDKKKGLEITTVLEIPPVYSAQLAVRVAIAAKARQGKPTAL